MRKHQNWSENYRSVEIANGCWNFDYAQLTINQKNPTFHSDERRSESGMSWAGVPLIEFCTKQNKQFSGTAASLWNDLEIPLVQTGVRRLPERIYYFPYQLEETNKKNKILRMRKINEFLMLGRIHFVIPERWILVVNIRNQIQSKFQTSFWDWNPVWDKKKTLMLRLAKHFKDQSCLHIDRAELLTGPCVAPLLFRIGLSQSPQIWRFGR